MSPKEAKRTLELLANGVDPTTGEILPGNHVVNSPSVIRALFLGVQALDTEPAKLQKTSSGGQAGKPWSTDEEQQLIAEFESGASIEQMSITHARSKGGIAARLVRLGKIDERSDLYVRESRPQRTVL
ncbi:TPA: hypothetical protein NID03_004559 [Pseudomonas aeruginosa]|uniref:hypothetical protein n=1 Tax=Pseudomonas aeruginosa TaxID=287 RepID=UPI0009390BD1|nr:hypothetical protein [Pseudomonas aeruginosa]MBG3955939.1 hypothetical protein [Pseudomonas aeruginosa]MBG4563247.1 hypothetical protein [Pseudomonas aeruginosa]MBG5404705.1 hypothetical protein [Pseudomonas aeruginosa]MBG5817721.1 hypothetical protein [Pseudomonas aeruginosa]MBH3980683.1 hypothetical protein [Pseudomonas aeruginosa]